MQYRTIEDILGFIGGTNREACLKILKDNRKLFQTVQGSTNNHQAWPGGYFDHVQEVLNIAMVLYDQLGALRPLPFSRSSLILVLYLHDIEKPWKYDLGTDGQLHFKPGMETKENHQQFRMDKLKDYGVQLTQQEENGIKYAEGELNDYSHRERKMSPLAAVAHMCDVASARLWYNHPLLYEDWWKGAKRIRD